MKTLENRTAAVDYFYNYINEGEELVTREEIEKAMVLKNKEEKSFYSLKLENIDGMMTTDNEEMIFEVE